MRPADLKSPFLWKDRHIVIKDRIWYIPEQFSDFNSFSFPGWHHFSTFDQPQPVCIEYCTGNGTWIAERALKYPQYNWVAVEKKFVRVRKIWSKINNFNLNNLLVANGEGHLITKHYIPSESVKSVYINFPDPWPKSRHAKHRLIQVPFVEQMWRVLEMGGDLTIVTDDEGYSNWIIHVFQKLPGFQSLFENPSFSEDYPDYGTSFFEDLWREKGKTIRYHLYRKIPHNT